MCSPGSASKLLGLCPDLQLAFQHVASAARTAKMVKNVAEGEVENTEDPQFKANLIAAKDHVTECTKYKSRLWHYLYPD